MDRCQIIPALRGHTHTVILLHDHSSTAQSLASSLRSSRASRSTLTIPEAFPQVRWVFPQAAVLPCWTTRSRRPQAQWFEMPSTSNQEDEDEYEEREWRMQQQHLPSALSASIAFILALIDEEAAHLGDGDNGRGVILGGVGQGCATAVLALLQGGRGLGGFVGVAGWLPFRAMLDGMEGRSVEETAELKQWLLRGLCETRDLFPVGGPAEGGLLGEGTPVMLAHCKDDRVVDVMSGREMREALRGLGLEVEWHAYGEGGHWVNEPRGVDDVVAFLEKVIMAGRVERDEEG